MGFSRNRGTVLGGPYKQDYSILGSILGTPYFGNRHTSGWAKRMLHGQYLSDLDGVLMSCTLTFLGQSGPQNHLNARKLSEKFRAFGMSGIVRGHVLKSSNQKPCNMHIYIYICIEGGRVHFR